MYNIIFTDFNFFEFLKYRTYVLRLSKINLFKIKMN